MHQASESREKTRPGNDDCDKFKLTIQQNLYPEKFLDQGISEFCVLLPDLLQYSVLQRGCFINLEDI